MKRLLCACTLSVLALPLWAVEYRTVDSTTILYDAPSQKGKKLFVIKRDTPVEIVVGIEGWYKIRDAEGGLAWLEKTTLAERCSVIVTVERAQIRRRADESALIVFEAEKNVALDYLETVPGGWLKVRHRDGTSGFVRPNQVWGA